MTAVQSDSVVTFFAAALLLAVGLLMFKIVLDVNWRHKIDSAIADLQMETKRNHEPITSVLAQHEESTRYLHAQNSKLIEQMLAISHPESFAAYRQAATVGIPPGSVPPVKLHEARPEPSASPAIERAVASAVRDVVRESGAPIPMSTTSGIDSLGGLP